MQTNSSLPRVFAMLAAMVALPTGLIGLLLFGLVALGGDFGPHQRPFLDVMLLLTGVGGLGFYLAMRTDPADAQASRAGRRRAAELIGPRHLR